MMDLLSWKTDKNIIMCLTTGRSGTNLLEQLLALAKDTCAVHEPEPAFHHVLEDVKRDPSAAVAFVRDRKLPDINARPQANYAETSHLFGKGFFEAFTALGVPFRLIILNREPREVAKSLWRIKTIPHRTKYGRNFLFDPEQAGVMKLRGWRRMSDYQLCYWYCLEVERRKIVYAAECRERGIPIVEISLEQLRDWGRFSQLCEECGLTLSAEAEARHAEISAHKVNRKEKHSPRLQILPFSVQEGKVWRALGSEGSALRVAVEARYAPSIAVLAVPLSPPPVFVINLKHSTLRRTRMEAQLNGLGLLHTFVDAVNGHDLQVQDLSCYAGIRRRLFFGRDLTRGEIGCLLSHRAIYRHMVEHSLPAAVVLEDDAILSPDFPTVIEALMRKPIKWDLIRFLSREKVYRQSRPLGPLTGDYKLTRVKGTPGGAYAYLLTNHAAKVLHTRMKKNWVPVDILHGQIWRTYLRTFSVWPSPAAYDDVVESTIGSVRFSKARSLTGWEKALYPVSRLAIKVYEFVAKRTAAAITWPADLLRRERLRREG